ncbi:DUF2851 family protein [Pontibacter sp. JH31]|uniref:DUF2851 family protein n=1 Tax=Pontibacter aquaedesilientis TaxID=2766980 RepID=A0ABR7XI08_9BACT|nr:DUF2851 family protein [Pontibacter aquaedesilientis]MBD1397896.1 DUF2851 family protein [Pontibacter aquaedesilientis]
MKEEFLHYIWQHQYFDKTDLCTVEGEPVQVLRVGMYNTDAGPDFKEALVRVGNVEWSGSVEIHLRATDWRRHQHQLDFKYNQVVLHVVWEADEAIRRPDGSLIPTLELKNRVNLALLQTYEQLRRAPFAIPCAAFWPQVPDITKTMMLGRALTERLELKGEEVLQVYRQLGNDWEATAYQLLYKGFGFKINQEPFERLARALPVQVVRKHYNNQFQLEALLFGQAGFLDNLGDEYSIALAKEYDYLSRKYGIKEQAMQRHHWNFLRMRPANFPTVRLAQLAALLTKHKSLFSTIIQTENPKAYDALWPAPVSAYWQKHYTFGAESRAVQTQLGKPSAQNLTINVAVPLLAAYASHTQEIGYLDKAVGLLEKVKEASNRITRQYEELGWKAASAADNQATLGLYKRYCQPVNCLRCAIGNKIMKQNLPTA